jgi:hypothetical protein
MQKKTKTFVKTELEVSNNVFMQKAGCHHSMNMKNVNPHTKNSSIILELNIE